MENTNKRIHDNFSIKKSYCSRELANQRAALDRGRTTPSAPRFFDKCFIVTKWDVKNMCVVAIIRYFILFSREGEGEEVVQFLPYIFYFFSQQNPLQEFVF